MLETCYSLNGLREGCRLAEFNRFVVSRRYYGKYLGPLLMKAGYQCAVQHGITHIVLSTRLELQEFYQKLGFMQVGEQYYDPMFPAPFNVTMVLDRIAVQNEWPCSQPRLYDFFTSNDKRIMHERIITLREFIKEGR